jgi:hypothetical protein
MMMTPEQFREAARLLFCVGTTGRALLDDLRKTHARPFTADPYRTAFNLGAQDLVNFLIELADE